MGEARAAPGVRDQFYMIMWAGLALNAGTVAEAPARLLALQLLRPPPPGDTQSDYRHGDLQTRDGANEKRRRR